MAAIIVARTGTAENREKGRRERILSTCIILNARRIHYLNILFAKPFASENKDDLEALTRSHTIPALSKLQANLHFWASGSFQHTVASLFICDYQWCIVTK